MNIQNNLGYHQILDHAWGGVGANRRENTDDS